MTLPTEEFVTVERVRERIEEIRAAKGNDHVQHSLEDDLRRDVLEAIADGAIDAQQLAALVLETSDIEFRRWYS